jgi:hypothetical protein
MKIREIITENDAGDSGGEPSGSHRRLTKDQHSSIPNLSRYPNTGAHYYAMYRFGVHMAKSPENQTTPINGPSSNEMTTLAYTDADKEIIDKTKRAFGFKTKTITSKGSTETNEVNKTSPVAKIKKNKYGV